jgi:hypothetical protein
MYKLFVVFCLLSCTFFKLGAKGSPPKKSVNLIHLHLRIDSSKVDARNFSSSALNKYRNDPEFDYHTNPERETWWDRFWEWLWHIIENLFSGSKTSQTQSNTPLKYVLLALIVGLLGYLITKIVGVQNIFNRASKDIALPYTESLENINAITFEEEIEKAIANRNYRLAVRLLYLRSLKQLNDAHLIDWQIEKTNSAYLNELTNNEQRRSFSILTRQFEYVWYGDFPIDGQLFQNINISFIDFKKMLS